jgi:syntaxin-binding protein 1
LKKLCELSLSFIPHEERVFTTNDAFGLHDFYSPHSATPRQAEVAAHIANVCATLGESPIVRFQNGSTNMASLAVAVQRRLDELRPYNSAMGAAAARNRSQVILLDRGFDLTSPLLHELTYQAAAHDLLRVPDTNIYSYVFDDAKGKRKEKKIVLGDDDELWDQLRHQHIAAATKGVSDAFAAWNAENQPKDGGKAKSKSDELRDMLQSMPQHQKQHSMFAMHLDLSKRIIDTFSQVVESTTNAEQNMVMGEEATGAKVKDFIACISDIIVNRQVSVQNKVRALMLCILASDGLPRDKLTRLLELGEIPQAEAAVLYNLQLLGADVETQKGSKKKKTKRRTRAHEYDLSRWTPLLKDIVEDATSGALSLSDFPCVRGAPDIAAAAGGGADEPVQSARSRGGWAGWKDKKTAKPGVTEKPVAAPTTESKGRVVVFIAGALSYSEIRVAHEVSSQTGWDVVVGSHAIAAPDAFVSKIGKLSERNGPAPVVGGGAAVGGGGAAVGGAGGSGGGPRPGELTFVKGSALNQGGMMVAAL